MFTPFASLERRVNSAVARRLANAMATIGAGEPFGVVFERQAVDILGVVGGASPSAGFELLHAPDIAFESAMAIDGKPYVVVGGLEPDASGWVTVQLREG